jgi:hypothetical protein
MEMKPEALPTTSTSRRLVVDTALPYFGSVVVIDDLPEELAAQLFLLLAHVQLILDVLTRRVDFVSQDVAVLRENVNRLTANLADCLSQLWQAF